MNNREEYEYERDAYARKLAASNISNEDFHAALTQFDREWGYGDLKNEDELDLGEDHYGRNV